MRETRTIATGLLEAVAPPSDRQQLPELLVAELRRLPDAPGDPPLHCGSVFRRR
jgi:hypothetical protein